MLMKIIDNVEMQCSAQEEAAIRTQWAAYDAAMAQAQPALDAQSVLQAKYPNILQAIDYLYMSQKLTPPTFTMPPSLPLQIKSASTPTLGVTS